MRAALSVGACGTSIKGSGEAGPRLYQEKSVVLQAIEGFLQEMPQTPRKRMAVGMGGEAQTLIGGKTTTAGPTLNNLPRRL